ncbi:MAG: molybdopterin molybdotransferase MoeA [Acidimicrobiales bacterium]
MIPLVEVQQLVLERCPRLGPVVVALGDALGAVLAEAVIVGEDVPPFANTAMDGYAVRSADTTGAPVELSVVGVLAAGSAPDRGVRAGEALQIMTGAPMPEGADAVAIVERCEPLPESRVRVLDEVHPGTHIRLPGSDMARGSVAVPAGTVLGPAHLGVLSSVGAEHAIVWRRPRVGVMSTGDELVPPGKALLAGQIRDSNRRALLGVLERDGYEGIDLGIVRDTEADVTAAFEQALSSCDAVLSSGGVSMGEFDYVKVVLDRLAGGSSTGNGAGGGRGEAHELSVAIRPAKPLALAWLPHEDRRVVFFGLPGNPVSALVSYQVVALPALRQMAGHPSPLATPVKAVAGEAFRRRADGRLNLVRVEARFRSDGRLEVRSAGGQSSHQLSAMAGANALALVPDGDGYVEGDEVEVLLLETPRA